MRCRIEVISMGDKTRVNQPDLLAGWLHTTQAQPRVRGHQPPPTVCILRFAFYGRISTADYQDADSSRAWQLDSAHRTITGHGKIVAGAEVWSARAVGRLRGPTKDLSRSLPTG
jgi:hypothetical protein